MLGALCLKVNTDDDDESNKTTFDLALAGMQFMGPVLLFYQALIQGGAKGFFVDSEVGGAMGDVRELAKSFGEAKEAAEGLEMGSLGTQIGGKLRAICGGAKELGSGIVAKGRGFRGRFKSDDENVDEFEMKSGTTARRRQSSASGRRGGDGSARCEGQGVLGRERRVGWGGEGGGEAERGGEDARRARTRTTYLGRRMMTSRNCRGDGGGGGRSRYKKGGGTPWGKNRDSLELSLSSSSLHSHAETPAILGSP